MSHTIRADFNEEQDLVRRARHISFDEEANWNAQISDIRLSIIEDYLKIVGSKMTCEMGNPEKYLEDMRLLAIRERKVPINVALMMFCDTPEKFFPRAWIELVVKPTPTGDFMEEAVFKGPVHIQLNRALQHIKNGLIRERIYKIDGEAEALRVFQLEVGLEHGFHNIGSQLCAELRSRPEQIGGIRPAGKGKRGFVMRCKKRLKRHASTCPSSIGGRIA